LLLVDKPAGPTSFDVIRRLRPALGPKLGHAGTLDPFATGLLLILAGKATRLATFLSGLDKSYRPVVQFGADSTTLDPEGELRPTERTTDEASAACGGRRDDRSDHAAGAARLGGAGGGERSYARMRRGEVAARRPGRCASTPSTLRASTRQPQRATIHVRCSKGTYVRQIAADLGAATGAGAYCAELRRLTVGHSRSRTPGPPTRSTPTRRGHGCERFGRRFPTSPSAC
jgi:tRNA pseudouridine55 synthase